MKRRRYLGLACIAIGVSQALFFVTGVIPIATDYLVTWIIGGINGGVFVSIGVEILRGNVQYETDRSFFSAVYVALVGNFVGLLLSHVA